MTDDALEYRTAERPVPGRISLRDFKKHVARYRFVRQFASSGAILDVGCGVGFGTDILRGFDGISLAVGFDVDAPAVSWAATHYCQNRLNFLQMDAGRPALANNAFTTVCAFEVIEHVPDPQSLLDEIYRLLKPGGWLILSTPNKWLYSPDRKRPINPYHFKEFYPEEFQQVLSRTFRVEQIYGQLPKRMPQTVMERVHHKLSSIFNHFLVAIYPLIPTWAIKAVKQSQAKYNYTPNYELTIEPELSVQPVTNLSQFDRQQVEVLSVMIAVCRKE